MKIVSHPKKKKNKYGNKRILLDGIWFQSEREGYRYLELKGMEQRGEIEELQLQVEFPVHINGDEVFVWFADFLYKEDGEPVVEDCKGFRTDVYKLKKKCVEAYYDIEILET